MHAEKSSAKQHVVVGGLSVCGVKAAMIDLQHALQERFPDLRCLEEDCLLRGLFGEFKPSINDSKMEKLQLLETVCSERSAVWVGFGDGGGDGWEVRA